MATLCLLVRTERLDNAEKFAKSGQHRRCLTNAGIYLKGLASGALLGTVDVYTDDTDPVAASIDVTLDFSAFTDGDTITIGGVTFTAKSSGATGDQFDIDTDDATTAENFKAAVNASSSINEIIAATRSAAVVTLTALLKGEIGNFLTVADSVSGGTPFSYTGSALAGGTGGALGSAETFSR